MVYRILYKLSTLQIPWDLWTAPFDDQTFLAILSWVVPSYVYVNSLGFKLLFYDPLKRIWADYDFHIFCDDFDFSKSDLRSRCFTNAVEMIPLKIRIT